MAKEKRKRKPNKGFSRSKKEWETSIAGHIGRAIDRTPVIDGLLNAGLAYLGYEAFGLNGLLVGPIGLKLATSMNVVAGATGVATLAMLGLCGSQRVQDIITAMATPGMTLIGGKLVPQDQLVSPTMSPTFPFELTCPEGYRLVRGPSAAVCVPIE